MGRIFLIRHGQASLGEANYDQLSPLGAQQAQRLGAYWAAQGLQPAAVYRGSLQRHAQTWAGIAQGLGASDLPQAAVWPGLNEYDARAVVRLVSATQDLEPRSAQAQRDYFRCLRTGLQQWARGEATPAGMPAYAAFAQGVAAVLADARAQTRGDVLVVSSGGPIATAVALTLGAPAEAFVELNLRIRNTAVTELRTTAQQHALQTFNTLPHLDAPEWADWVTYA